MAENLKNKSLGFFLTKGVPLRQWYEMGIFSREIELYNTLADHFQKIYIFTHGGKEELEYKKYFKNNVEIIYNSTKMRGTLYSLILPLVHRKILKKCNFLKTNQMLGSEAPIIAKILSPKTKLVIRTGHQLSFVKKRKKQYIGFIKALLLEFMAYLMCDVALVTSKQMKDQILKWYPIKEKDVIVVPNYINTDIFKPLDLEKHTNRVVFVGRVIPQKNLPNLVLALKDTNIALDIIGDRSNNENLQKLAEENNVELKFVAHSIPNETIPEYLNRYPIFVLPSKFEGMPKTLLEGMSCGMACVGTNVAGTKELIEHNKTGLLAEPVPESLRGNIVKLINDKNLQKTIGSNARKFIQENYSLSKGVKEEIRIYES